MKLTIQCLDLSLLGNSNGTDYPADTLYSLVMCIQLYMEQLGNNINS